jgi:hypothetical protein
MAARAARDRDPEWKRSRARKPYDPRGSAAARAIAEEIVTIALALKMTPTDVRALSWDEATAYLAILARNRRRAAARARARRAR